jgi:hypothetical protein
VYSISRRGGASSGSSGQTQGELRLVLTDDGVSEFGFGTASDGRRVSFRQSPGEPLVLSLQEPIRRVYSLLILHPFPHSRVQLLVADPEGSWARSWPSREEAFRSNAPEMREKFIPVLRSFPLGLAYTPWDPEILGLCLGWQDPPEDAVRRGIEGLGRKDPASREAALGELIGLVEKDPRRLRFVAASIEKTNGEEIIKGLRAVIGSQKAYASAVFQVTTLKLYRDVRYLGALLGASQAELAAQAKARLRILVGIEFSSQSHFDGWLQKNLALLEWDEAGGCYRIGR